MMDEREHLHYPVCAQCVAGEGSECHEPGCSFFLHDVPAEGLIAGFGLDVMDVPGNAAILAISKWLDEFPANAARHPEVLFNIRVNKVYAEAGEVADAMSGLSGENPRKGKTHTLADVEYELLDVATAALGALCHILGNDPTQDVFARLDEHAQTVACRALGDDWRTP